MIKSMTGYGRGQTEFSGGTITAEIKSVNSRFFDCNVKTPRLYGYLEEAAKSRLNSAISRGKLDVYITVDLSGTETDEITLNLPVVNAYMNAFNQMERLGIKNNAGTDTFARLPDVFIVKKTERDAEQTTEDMLRALDMAMAEHGDMRAKEGAKLLEDVASRTKAIEEMVSIIEELSPKCAAEYREKLETRMRELIGGAEVDETRLITETAIYADKIAVAEETVRLRSHLAQLDGMLTDEKPTGRRMDFLVQEINREVNTIGSKVNNAELARTVVDMKSEIEKIREQIQNIE